MLLFDPDASRVVICSESARIVDSVFVIIRLGQDYFYEDGEGRIAVFRTAEHAARVSEGLEGGWGVYEIHAHQVLVFLNKPHICTGETYAGNVRRVSSPETE